MAGLAQCLHALRQRLAQGDDVASRCHDDTDRQRLATVIAHECCGRIAQTAMHMGHIAQAEGAAIGTDQGGRNGIDAIERAIRTQGDAFVVHLEETGAAQAAARIEASTKSFWY